MARQSKQPLRTSIGSAKESLADFATRYSILASPTVQQQILRGFTQFLDVELRKSLVEDGNHPEDTGLMKRSWVLPKRYLSTHSGTRWEVYLENTATVGQQYKLKYGKELYSSRKYNVRGYRGIAKRKERRYMPFVNSKGIHKGFYTRKLRAIRNRIPYLFKYFISNTVLHQAATRGLLNPSELKLYDSEFT